MRATILVDNLAARGLEAEWGLSIYVEYQGHAILLDTGASDRFARNADTLGIDLSTVSFGVLSHAHWDHGNGMGTFFARNPTAPFYLRQGCGETCYDKTPEGWRYEGLQRGLLTTFAPRIRYVTGDFSPLPGVTLLPHKTPAWRSGAGPPTCTKRWGTSGFPMTSPTSRVWSFPPPRAW